MFKKIVVGGMVAVLFIAGLVFSNQVGASGVLQIISVDFSIVKRIVIDGVDKTPAGDLAPFVYNGKTYVPLRYVAESLGKPVNWDGKTGTIYIGDTPQSTNTLFDDFSQPLSKNWVVPAGTWSIQNNAAVNSSECILELDQAKFPLSSAYSVEADVSIPRGESDRAGFALLTDGYYKPNILLWDDGVIRGSNICVNVGSTEGHLKVSVNGNTIDVYFNGNYVTSSKIDNPNGHKLGLINCGGIIKNVKIINN